jgi:hypothetical protein
MCVIYLITRYSIVLFLQMFRPDFSRHVCLKTSPELLNVSDIPKTNSHLSLKYYMTLWKVVNVRNMEIK